MTKKLVVGNWKMNPLTSKEAEKLFSAVAKNSSGVRKTEIVICPPFTYLESLRKISKKVQLGAQDAFFGDTGAFTGEISTEMIYNQGARYVILGHSERRALGETNEIILKKLKSALSSSLTPILCVGEDTRDENHEYFSTVQNQVIESLKSVPRNMLNRVVIAYEPVWALSTTKERRDATPKDCEEMVIFIRKTLATLASPEVAAKTRVIYGGSVTPRDAGGFLEEGGADGLLVGRASLDAKKFSSIINIAENI